MCLAADDFNCRDPHFHEHFLIFFINTSGSGYGSVVPDAQNADTHPLTKTLGEKIGGYVKQYIEAMEKVN